MRWKSRSRRSCSGSGRGVGGSLGTVVEDDEAGQLVDDGAAGPEDGDEVAVDVDQVAGLGVEAPPRLLGRPLEDLGDVVVEATGER